MNSISTDIFPSTLPNNASKLQRDLDYSIGPSQLTKQTTATIPGIKYNPPDFMLPWLIWEYGLEQLLPYLNDPRRAIQEGVQWQRIRGTPGSLDMALGWLGLDEVTIEPEVTGDHFYQYQIDSGRIVKNQELTNVQAVAKFSAPLRSRLSRIYHGYDVRRLVLDESDYGAMLSDYSGIDKNGIVLSFGREHQSALDINPVAISAVRISEHGSHTKDTHWPTLDNQPLGGEVTIIERYSQIAIEAILTSTVWLGDWDQRQWNDPAYWMIGTKHLQG